MPELPVIDAVTSVAGTAYSISQQSRAAGVQREAARTQQNMQRIQATRQRRSAIRQAMRARAEMQVQAQGMGALGGSGVAAAGTALSSQLGANLGFGSVMSGLGQQYTGLTAQASQLQTQAQFGQLASGLAFQALPYMRGGGLGGGSDFATQQNMRRFQAIRQMPY
jgi:hypothetical protein